MSHDFGEYGIPHDADEEFVNRMASLSIPVKRRLNALRKLQLECEKINCDYEREVMALRKKFHTRYDPLYKKRAAITGGEIEPTDEECRLPESVPDYVLLGREDGAAVTGTAAPALEAGTAASADQQAQQSAKGVPLFWSECMMNNSYIAELVHEPDLPVLEKLVDIRLSYLDEQPGFQLDFVFAPNDYFTNQILTKKYVLAEFTDPIGEGFELQAAVGTEINWNPGKDLTVIKEQQYQRHRSMDTVRKIDRIVPAETFFNCFKSYSKPETKANQVHSDAEMELQSIMAEDLAIGEEFRDNIVPQALFWYTGEAFESENEGSENEYGDSEEGYSEHSY